MSTLSGKRYHTTLNPLPATLRDRNCAKPLKTRLLTDRVAGPQRLQVLCNSDTPWSIYIKGSIDLYVDVLVSRYPLNKDDIPQVADFTLARGKYQQITPGLPE